jgi:hypothetical protein
MEPPCAHFEQPHGMRMLKNSRHDGIRRKEPQKQYFLAVYTQTSCFLNQKPVREIQIRMYLPVFCQRAIHRFDLKLNIYVRM